MSWPRLPPSTRCKPFEILGEPIFSDMSHREKVPTLKINYPPGKVLQEPYSRRNISLHSDFALKIHGRLSTLSSARKKILSGVYLPSSYSSTSRLKTLVTREVPIFSSGRHRKKLPSLKINYRSRKCYSLALIPEKYLTFFDFDKPTYFLRGRPKNHW